MQFLLTFTGILLIAGTGTVNSQYPSYGGYQGGSSYNDPYSKGYPGSNSGYGGYGSNSGGIGQYNSGYSGSYSPYGQSGYQGGNYGYNQNPANNESPYGDFGIRHQIDSGYPNWYPNNDDGIPYGDGNVYPYFSYDRTPQQK